MHRKFIDCQCGASWTQGQFANLREPKNGTMQDDGAGGWIELRVCVCGSCIARELYTPLSERGLYLVPESPIA